MLNMKVCPSHQLSQIIEDRNIVCFGAGKNFKTFLNAYRGLKKNIICILDNNKNLSGTTVEGLPVHSIDDFMQRNMKDFILMITSINYAYEIVSQLDQLRVFDGIDAYIHVWNNCYNEKHEFEFLKGKQKIPKIIHYAWFGRNPIPKHLQVYIDTWKKFCPDYQIIRWDESNYDISKNRYMKQAYEARQYGFVSDYVRLDVVKNYGGTYLDVDVELLKNLDPLLCYDFYCGFEIFCLITTGMYGAQRGHPLLDKLIQPYENMEFIHDGVINKTTCDIYNTQVLVAEGFYREDSYQLKDGIAIFPREVFYPGGGLNALNLRSKNSFALHHYEGSWAYDINQRNQIKAVWMKLAKLYDDRIKI